MYNYNKEIIIKFKKNLIITTLISSLIILSGCTNSFKEASSKEKGTIKSEVNTENNAVQSKLSEENHANKSNTNIKNNPNEKERTTKTDKEAEDDRIIFKSRVGFSIKFPSNWKDRYTIKEDDNSMYVYFKSTDPKTRENTGLLFVIMKDFDSEDESMYDSVDDEKHITLGDKTYFIGEPTDVALNPENGDFDIFVAMSNERKKVIDNISLT